MKVLLTADPIGGVWSYALELCTAFRSLQVRVALATLGRSLTPVQRRQVAELPNVALYESAFRLEWMPEPWDDLKQAGDWLLRLERETRPDVVHLNHLVHADLPWRAPVLTVGHSCVLSWWMAVRHEAIPTAWATYRRRVTESLRAARCVVAPTLAMLTELERYYGPFHETAVIHNGRDGRRFSAGHKEQLVLCAGRLWDGAKNVAALAAVAPHIAAPVMCAGEVTDPQGHGVAPQGIQLLGALEHPQLADWYRKAAVYALPARYEPFGLTVLEAALSGCALVLGEIDSLREVWGAAARYVAPEDHAGLCDTLDELLLNDSVRNRMAARAMARARQLTPARCAGRYVDLYRQMRCVSPCSITH
jgi:glycosyltransferase involved in cell wall biosynthesis